MAEVIVSAVALDGIESPLRRMDQLHITNMLDTNSRILRQMERYLSDENLLRDRLLQKYLLLDETNQGFIPLDLFSSFAKVKKITTDQDVFRDALRKSDFLVMNAEETHIRRKVPLVLPTKTLKWNSIQKNSSGSKTPVKSAGSEESISSSLKSSTSETDTASDLPPSPSVSQASSLADSQNFSDATAVSRSEETPPGSPLIKAVNIIEGNTIYVSHIPKNSDKSSLVSIFSIAGVITRIDIPLDKKSGNSKGITFIEYETEDQAKKAIEHFNTPDNIAFQLGIRVKPYKMGLKNVAGKAPSPTSSSESSAPSATGSITNSNSASEPSEDYAQAARRKSMDNSMPSTPEIPEFQRSSSVPNELIPKSTLDEADKKKRKRGKKKGASEPQSPANLLLTNRPPSAPSDILLGRSQSDRDLVKKNHFSLSESQPVGIPNSLHRDWNSTNSLLSGPSKFASFHKSSSQTNLTSSPPSKSNFSSSMPIIPSYHGNREPNRPDFRDLSSRRGAHSPTQDDRQRPILFQRADQALIVPIRQPKGPDGTKGFASGRGRLIKL